jgi:glyoxylase-like metal-dependent hydrolase (beta-lactamase superfamily II)
VVTHSVGQVQVGELMATYCGKQTSTANHRGEPVYGVSQLLLARGGFAALLALDLPPAVRTAVDQALVYHRAADHSGGNYRVLTNLAAQLLATGAQRELPQLDEKLYFEVFAPPAAAPVARRSGRAR